jgi:hypothetical protein
MVLTRPRQSEGSENLVSAYECPECDVYWDEAPKSDPKSVR